MSFSAEMCFMLWHVSLSIFIILNPLHFMLCPQHTLSRCGWVGPQFLWGNQIPTLVFPTRFPLVCLTFLLFGPFDHTPFCLELESHSNPNNLVDCSPTAWWKKDALSEWIRGFFFSSSAHVIHETFFVTHDCLRGCMSICKIHLAMRSEATWRLFLFFGCTFLSIRRWCWSRYCFMLRGTWGVAL